jgi:protein phosphatase
MADDDQAPPHRPWRRWVFAGTAVAVIALIIVGAFITRAMVRNSYYVGAENNEVVIFQGSPDKVLFLDLSSANQSVCVTGLDQEQPQVEFVEYDTSDTCTPLQTSDLAELDRNAVEGKSIRNMPLSDAEPTPTPAPVPGQPAPRPSPTPATPPAPSPASSTPASTTSSSLAPQYDNDGNKICRGH